MDVGPLVSQDQSGQKHEQIHDQVKLGREGGENPVGAAHRGHEQEYKNQGRHHQGLEEQDVWVDCLHGQPGNCLRWGGSLNVSDEKA